VFLSAACLTTVNSCGSSGGLGHGSNTPPVASLQVLGADVALSDANLVTVQGLAIDGGNSNVVGTQEVGFSASESEGPGIAAATLFVDGQPVASENPDSGNPTCVNTPVSGESYGYTSTQPCNDSVSSTFNLNTAKLGNGGHTLAVSASDAAGNTTSETINFTTDNPTNPSSTNPGTRPGSVVNGLRIVIHRHVFSGYFGSTAGTVIRVYQRGHLVGKSRTKKGGKILFRLSYRVHGRVTVRVGKLSKTLTVSNHK
jgi:hypothetical protein